MLRRSGILLTALAASQCAEAIHSGAGLDLNEPGADETPRNYHVKVLRKLPHVGKPFTQGLEFRTLEDGSSELVETSGSYPVGTHSFIRGVDMKTGATKWKSSEGIGDSFIEGIVQSGSEGHWFASVYQEPRKTIEYDKNFKVVGQHPYHFDGWGLTRSVDGNSFLATNGSSAVMTLKGDGSFSLVEEKTATCLGKPVPALNELELVPNFLGKGPALLGNVYTSRVVLALNPDTMKCIGAFHLDGIDEATDHSETLGFHVANGVAFNSQSGTFYVTGKNWENMFEIEVSEDPQQTPQSQLVEESAQQNALGMLESWLGTKHTAPGILP